MNNRICVISSNYPHPKFPEYGAFVEKHVKEWERMGSHVDVVAPISVPTIFRTFLNDNESVKIGGSQVVRPIYLSVSNKVIGPVQFHKMSRLFFVQAVMRGIKKLNAVPDLFYGKFLLTGGVAAFKAGKKYNRPIYLDLGESRLIERMNREEIKIAREVIPHFDKIFCVSQRLVDEAIELGANPDNVVLAPNTVNTEKFRPLNKDECRDELELPQDEFIVIFVGHHIERKGPLRVLNAINSLNGNVKGVFLGKGKQKPVGESVLFADSVPNGELPKWLNAADVFVLPTLAEGHCNSIIEAMACGLPIITSNIDDIKGNYSNSDVKLVDPLSIKEIKNAIAAVNRDQELRSKLIEASISLSNKLNETARFKQIRKYLSE